MALFSWESSSFHLCNGDRSWGPLSRLKPAVYRPLNWLNNQAPEVSLFPGLRQGRFCPSPAALPGLLEGISREASPSRVLSEVFLKGFPWAPLRKALGGELHVLDFGCGSGRYSETLGVYTGAPLDSYRGVDLRQNPHWAARQTSRIEFKTIAQEIHADDIPPRTNLIVSQSALEHVERDVAVLRTLDQFTAHARKPVIQIHLIPSAACLRLYGLHGVRQYTPRSVSRIVRALNPGLEHLLIGLGGERCNRVHADFIVAKDRRREELERYALAVRSAIEDSARGEPAFYAWILARGVSIQSEFSDVQWARAVF